VISWLFFLAFLANPPRLLLLLPLPQQLPHLLSHKVAQQLDKSMVL
jgi:hypothetical protein